MRLLFIFCLFVWPSLSLASFQVTNVGCVSAGETISIIGAGFGARPSGLIRLNNAPRTFDLRVKTWSNQRVRVVLPRSGLSAGESYDLRWTVRGAKPRLLGKIKICSVLSAKPKRASRDVVPTQNGAPEYIAIVPRAQSGAAQAALEQQGALVLRRRALPQMNHVNLIFGFSGDLSLSRARAVLKSVAPTSEIDLHHIYGFASGPRHYAAALVGDEPGQTCRLQRQVRIGIIDGPINLAHPSLNGVSVLRTSVLTAGEKRANSDHGTAVVGLIAGHPTGKLRAGFAPGAQILAVEAFSNAKGLQGARLENIAAGIDWLRAKNTRIVNMSIAGSPNRTFTYLLSLARQSGMIIIAAAGNDATSAPRLPAASVDTIAVTAVDAAGRIYRSANTGAHIEFAAPGVDLYVAKGRAAGYRSGTSYAAPIVTALVARLAQHGPVSLDNARRQLRLGARDLGVVGRDAQFGHGLVQTAACRN